MAKDKKSVDFYSLLEEKFSDYYVEPTKNRKQVDVISTGSLSLDVSLGVNGLARGRFTELYGPPGAGKSTLALCTARNAINEGLRVLYIDAEQGIEDVLAKNILGDAFYDRNKFVWLQPNIMEEALLIAENAILSGQFGLIILDSIASMLPRKVKEDDLDDSNVALLARRLTVFVQRNAFNVQYNNVAFLGINQIRSKIGSYFGGWDTPGGWEWKHICSVQIELRGGKKIDVVGEEESIGINTNFTVRKNKLASPFRGFTIPILFGKGVDYLRDVIEFSKALGVIQVAGPYYKFEDETLGQGMNKTLEFLNNSPEVLDKIVSLCYSTNKSNVMEVVANEEIIESGTTV